MDQNTVIKNTISLKTTTYNKGLKGQLKNLQNQISLPLYFYKLYLKLEAGKSIKDYPDIFLPKSILKGSAINTFTSFANQDLLKNFNNLYTFQNDSKTFSDRSLHLPLLVLTYVLYVEGEKEYLTGKPSSFCLSNTLFLNKHTKFNFKNSINKKQGKTMIPYNDAISLKELVEHYYF